MDDDKQNQGATPKTRKPRAKKTTQGAEVLFVPESPTGLIEPNDAKQIQGANEPITKRVRFKHIGQGEPLDENLAGSEKEAGERDGLTTKSTTDDKRSGSTTQSTDYESENAAGEVLATVSDGAEQYSGGLTREETRAKATNRWVLEGRRWETDRFRQDKIRQFRSAGMTKEQASNRAWEACLAQFPPPGSPVATEPPAPIEAEEEPSIEPAPTPIPSDQGVPGLGTIPADWPKLPANASLQVEISWVSANRLVVRSGAGVDLSRALSPAPSYSALSWLETSILFPSKFADISVKATATQDDEREGIRREKLAIEEIRSLLAEMLEG